MTRVSAGAKTEEDERKGDGFLTHRLVASLQVKHNDCQCTFPDCSLHGGVTLTVEVSTNQRRLSEMLVYTNPGRESTGRGDPSAPREHSDSLVPPFSVQWTHS